MKYKHALSSRVFCFWRPDLLPCPVRKSIDLFNGKDLSGWMGKEQFWKVENATIIGETTAENPTKGNTFLIWQEEVQDFEFTCMVKFQGK